MSAGEEIVLQTLRSGVGVQIIRDYIIPLMDRDESLIKRINIAKTLPSIVVSVVLRIARSDLLGKKLLMEIEFYKKMGVDLTEIDRRKGVINWYLENVGRREGEEINRWLERVAIASLMLVSEVYAGYEIVKENIVSRYIREMIAERYGKK